MSILLTFVHVVVCLFLIIVVLLQSGKAADLAGAFGGMGSQTTFGPRGSATVLSKATTISAALFMLTSLFLSVLTTRSAGASQSVLPAVKPPSTKAAPAKPGAAPTVNITPSNGGAPQTVPLNVPKQQAPAGGQPATAPPKK